MNILIVIILGILAMIALGISEPLIKAYAKKISGGNYSISDEGLTELKEQLVIVTEELKNVKNELVENKERLNLLEQNYNFAENLLENNKDEEKPKSLPENY